MTDTSAEKQRKYRERKKLGLSQRPKQYSTDGDRKKALQVSYKKYKQSAKGQRTSWNNHLKRHYGITIDQYEQMLTHQDNRCHICKSENSLRDWKDGRVQRISLFVDHCHVTGKVRGLLCNKCNIGLAMFNDSTDLLVSAISYIKENDNY